MKGDGDKKSTTASAKDGQCQNTREMGWLTAAIRVQRCNAKAPVTRQPDPGPLEREKPQDAG